MFLADVGSLELEMGALSQATGNATYSDAAERAFMVVLQSKQQPGGRAAGLLYRIYDVHTAQARCPQGSPALWPSDPLALWPCGPVAPSLLYAGTLPYGCCTGALHRRAAQARRKRHRGSAGAAAGSTGVGGCSGAPGAGGAGGDAR